MAAAAIPLTDDGLLTKRVLRAAPDGAAVPLRRCRIQCHYVATLPSGAGTPLDARCCRRSFYFFIVSLTCVKFRQCLTRRGRATKSTSLSSVRTV